jgi:stage V sporulation protein SpoVS
VLKVSGESKAKGVAGSISHVSREGECPTLVAIGSKSINQALKGATPSPSRL